MRFMNTSVFTLFQSTHSLRSATCLYAGLPHRRSCFNPRTPCGVRHALAMWTIWKRLFQSTHSLRSATQYRCPYSPTCQVSIHALLAECDCEASKRKVQVQGFNPRTPCGVRLLVQDMGGTVKEFQSTHSLRSATELTQGQKRIVTGFNPRTPCGVRLRPTLYIATQQSKSYFAPTSLKRPSLHGCSF